jgi:hypothetical protein
MAAYKSRCAIIVSELRPHCTLARVITLDARFQQGSSSLRSLNAGPASWTFSGFENMHVSNLAKGKGERGKGLAKLCYFSLHTGKMIVSWHSQS